MCSHCSLNHNVTFSNSEQVNNLTACWTFWFLYSMTDRRNILLSKVNLPRSNTVCLQITNDEVFSLLIDATLFCTFFIFLSKSVKFRRFHLPFRTSEMFLKRGKRRNQSVGGPLETRSLGGSVC